MSRRLTLRDLESDVDVYRSFERDMDLHIIHLQNVISHLERAKSYRKMGQPELSTNALQRAKTVLSLAADELAV